MNLCQLLDAPARQVPEREALVFSDGPVLYRELERATLACAARLFELGLGPGDRIALLDDASLLFLASVLGAARIGAAAVPLHVQLTTRELSELVVSCNCHSQGIAGAAYAEKLGRALNVAPLTDDDLLTRDPGAAPEINQDADLECVVILTSGTTGLPKPVGITHATLAPRIQGFAGNPEFSSAARSLVCVPGVHIGGLGGLLTGLASGGTMVIQKRFDAGEWLQLAAQQRVHTAFLVPTMARRILDHPDFDSTDLSNLRAVSYGAAAAPASLVEEMIRRFPNSTAFSNVFGQTETTGAITALSPADHQLDENGHLLRPGSVGTPLPGVEIRIVDPETGDTLPPGATGELWVRSPFNAADGWRQTGDFVRQDEDGHLYPTGRLSDTINRGGEKFGPVEIEAVLREHPAVADVAVAGIPDPEMGERVGVAIVRCGALSEDEVLAHCRSALARYKVPERIAFVDEIPHTALYKVSRRTIAQLIARETDGSSEADPRRMLGPADDAEGSASEPQ
jgi:long-chain acyl-CoA synthetase